jgi:regulatory protein
LEDGSKNCSRLILVPTITSIKPQKKRKRFNIYLDERYSFSVSAEVLAKADLKVNQEIPEKEIERLKHQDIESRLYDRVLRFLAYRQRSKKETRDYLKKKGGEIKIINKIIKKLKKQRLIDDRSFAEWWIEQRSCFRPKGRQALYFELIKKGISEEIIEDALFSVKDELLLAQKAAQKKIKNYKNLEPFELRQKMIAFLARRGFSWETIKKVLDHAERGS